MAIALEPNSTYNLLSEDVSSANRVFLHVKLTDSCLRALEEFQTYQAVTKRKPSIRFSGQSGQIVIPGKGSRSEDGLACFQFSCSGVEKTAQQGSIDCIQQTNNSLDMVYLGMVTHKVNVMATDDSYHMTQQRMKEVEEVRQGTRTKVIKTPSQGGKGNKGSQSYKHQNKILNAVKRKTPAVPKISSGASKSVREHVVHLLAVRPYNKLELVSKLRRDGVSLKDKNSLTNILQQIAVMSDNLYNLMKHIFPEIQVDTWPYYNDDERERLRRQMQSQDVNYRPQFNSAPVVRDSSKTKRAVPCNDSGQSSKKQRISRINNNHESVEVKNDSITKIISAKAREKSSTGSAQQKKEEYAVDGKDVLMNTTDLAGEKEHHFTRRYKAITSHQQRCAYKKDFQADFEKYTKLKSSIEAVTRKFMKLDERLKRSAKGSDQRQKIEQEILELYQRQKDSQWLQKKKRFQELHAKLSHIKELIADYDRKAILEKTL